MRYTVLTFCQDHDKILRTWPLQDINIKELQRRLTASKEAAEVSRTAYRPIPDEAIVMLDRNTSARQQTQCMETLLQDPVLSEGFRLIAQVNLLGVAISLSFCSETRATYDIAQHDARTLHSNSCHCQLVSECWLLLQHCIWRPNSLGFVFWACLFLRISLCSILQGMQRSIRHCCMIDGYLPSMSEMLGEN